MSGPVEDALLQRASNSKRPQPQLHLILHVQDSGLGIPTPDLLDLFNRRFRGTKTQSNIPGTGLGLAIVRDTLEELGGAIELFSPAIALAPLPLSNEIPGISDFYNKENGSNVPPTLVPVANPNLHTGTSVILWLPLHNPASINS